MYALVPFHPPEPAGPVSLGDLVLAAKDSTLQAFHSALDQIRRLRAVADSERRGNRVHAARLRGEADRNTAATVESFLDALLHLRRLQSTLAEWMDARLDQMAAVDPGLFDYSRTLMEWDIQMPAVNLIAPCWIVITGMDAVCEVPETTALEEVTTSIFDKLDLRINARSYGSDPEFLSRVATLMHLPELVNAA